MQERQNSAETEKCRDWLIHEGETVMILTITELIRFFQMFLILILIIFFKKDCQC